MILKESLLISLIRLIDRLPEPPKKVEPRKPGRPTTYADRLFLKALVFMILRRIRSSYEMLAILDQPTVEMQTLRQLLTENDRFPSRRTWERRLAKIPETLPAQIGCLGRHLVAWTRPWEDCGRAAACDSTTLGARGGVWHKKDREKGIVPHSRIDTQAHWTKSGWHGWVFGWKLHLLMTVGDVWIPLAARLTPANVDDGEAALELAKEAPADLRYWLGDRHYNRDELRAYCWARGWELVTSRYGRYPHQGGGKEVRRIFHKLRSVANENFNELYKSIFESHDHVPTKGLVDTQLWALGAIFVYQLALWYRFEHGLDLRIGVKHFLKAA